jgi:EAL domain-containing protein (putative c-di-GMP-specific phosphodiesterase class I)
VIAEGVETEEQLHFLQKEGCSEGQGYFFSRPIIAEQFAEFLERGVTESVVH